MVRRIIRLPNFLYRLVFKYKQVPTLRQIRFFLSNVNSNCNIWNFDYNSSLFADKITIGTLKWLEECNRPFKQGRDPEFRRGLSWFGEAEMSMCKPYLLQLQDDSYLSLFTTPQGENMYLESNFKLKYGSIRICARMPDTGGCWSALWTTDSLPECDIIEHCGSRIGFNVTHHWGESYAAGEHKQTRSNYRENIGLNLHDWNVYELHRYHNKVVYKINGVTTRIVRGSAVPNNEHRLIMNITNGWNYCERSVPQFTDCMDIKWIEIKNR